MTFWKRSLKGIESSTSTLRKPHFVDAATKWLVGVGFAFLAVCKYFKCCETLFHDEAFENDLCQKPPHIFNTLHRVTQTNTTHDNYRCYAHNYCGFCFLVSPCNKLIANGMA